VVDYLARDFNHIKALADDVGEKFKTGVVLYTGKEIIPFAKDLFACRLKCFGNLPSCRMKLKRIFDFCRTTCPP